MGLKTASSVINELERKMKLSENIIRFVNINVDSISAEPSPILRSKSSDHEEIVDVTINKD